MYVYTIYHGALCEYRLVYQFRNTLGNKSYSYVSNVTYIVKIGKHFAKTQHDTLDRYLADINIFYT
jgi:hypothetical protein